MKKKQLLMLETPISVMCEPSLSVTVVFPPEVEAVATTLPGLSVARFSEIRSPID